MKYLTGACLSILLFATLPASLHPAAFESGRCGQCGMDLSKFSRTQYEVRWKDGTSTKTCGVQCGLTQQILHRDKFKSAIAKDYVSGRTFDADKGFYVFGSRIVADMAPGFIAFRFRLDAEKFQKESGGKVMSFDEALKAWTERKAHH
jgi:copper chaperone NosL